MLCERATRPGVRQFDSSQDRFTTDFFLVDGSYGTIANGSFNTTTGNQANLITGSFQLANGSTGNIYSAASTEMPNTSKLPIPTPWTSSGVGSAIPGSQLGNLATYTSTLPGSYPPPTTAAPSTVSAETVYGGYTLSTAATVPSYTVPGTSLAGSTYTIVTTRPSITPPITSRAERIIELPIANISMAVFIACVVAGIMLL